MASCTLTPAQIEEILLRIEEVRPIHVLINNIIIDLEFTDQYPFDLVEDTCEAVATIEPFADRFLIGAGVAGCEPCQPRRDLQPCVCHDGVIFKDRKNGAAFYDGDLGLLYDGAATDLVGNPLLYDGAWCDPSAHWELSGLPIKYGRFYEILGDPCLVLRDNGGILYRHDGTIPDRDNPVDAFGDPYDHSGVTQANALYFHNCLGYHSADSCEVDLDFCLEDTFDLPEEDCEVVFDLDDEFIQPTDDVEWTLTADPTDRFTAINHGGRNPRNSGLRDQSIREGDILRDHFNFLYYRGLIIDRLAPVMLTREGKYNRAGDYGALHDGVFFTHRRAGRALYDGEFFQLDYSGNHTDVLGRPFLYNGEWCDRADARLGGVTGFTLFHDGEIDRSGTEIDLFGGPPTHSGYFLSREEHGSPCHDGQIKSRALGDELLVAHDNEGLALDECEAELDLDFQDDDYKDVVTAPTHLLTYDQVITYDDFGNFWYEEGTIVVGEMTGPGTYIVPDHWFRNYRGDLCALTHDGTINRDLQDDRAYRDGLCFDPVLCTFYWSYGDTIDPQPLYDGEQGRTYDNRAPFEPDIILRDGQRFHDGYAMHNGRFNWLPFNPLRDGTYFHDGFWNHGGVLVAPEACA